ncbi:MAG: hypothetical protein Q8R92_09320, partial [Deltaproteobacteria bacterium]|nr:hypothetical protein [Deltaproteobacteria bacterium]
MRPQPDMPRSVRPREPRSIAPYYKDRLALAVFLLALALRLAWVLYGRWTHPGEDWYIAGDANEYTTVAANLLSGKGWWSPDQGGGIYHHGPVFPLFLAGMRALGASLFVVTLVNALIGAFTCWAVVRIARRMMTPGGALLAGL